MKEKIESHEKGYDTRLIASDWRYSASIVGLLQYFDYFEDVMGKKIYEEEEDAILYYSGDITEERYLKFAEHYFKEDMSHKKVEEWLREDEFSEEQIKLINEKIVGNIASTVMNSVFGKDKFDGTNKEKILELLDENRYLIIKETFRNKKNLYYNYANTNLMLKTENQPHCRLVGYNIDEGRKSKSISYQFDIETFVQEDCLEFDFIPFAFTNTREALFINNNFTVYQLMQTFQKFKDIIEERKEEGRESAKEILFRTIIESTDFIDFDVEVIVKNREKAFFETLFIRKEAVWILQSLNDKAVRAFCFSYKRGEKYYINIQNEVANHILNNILLDDLIELFLKDNGSSYLINQFIDINLKIKGGREMTQDMKSAYACAKEVVKKLEENKINSYRQKLISAIIFHDYNRACDILLQLSNYSEISFGFAYPLFEDFEGHKEVAYTFINALEYNKKNGQGGQII